MDAKFTSKDKLSEEDKARKNALILIIRTLRQILHPTNKIQTKQGPHPIHIFHLRWHSHLKQETHPNLKTYQQNNFHLIHNHHPYPSFTPRKSRNVIHTLPNPIIITKTGHIKILIIYKIKPKISNKTNTQYQPTNKWKPNKTHKKYANPHFTFIHLGNTVPITKQKINKNTSQTLNTHSYQNP